MSADYEPPPDDSLFEEAPPVGVGDSSWTVPPAPRGAWSPDERLLGCLNRIATALETLAQNASRPPSAPLGAAGPPPAQGMPPKASNGPDTTKMGKKVYAVCRTQGWDVKEIGEQILGRPVNPNSQKWPFEDLRVVLDQFTEWNV